MTDNQGQTSAPNAPEVPKSASVEPGPPPGARVTVPTAPQGLLETTTPAWLEPATLDEDWYPPTPLEGAQAGVVVLGNGHRRAYDDGIEVVDGWVQGVIEGFWRAIPASAIREVLVTGWDDEEPAVPLADRAPEEAPQDLEPRTVDDILEPTGEGIDDEAAEEIAAAPEYPVTDVASKVAGGTPVPPKSLQPSPAQAALAAARKRPKQ